MLTLLIFIIILSLLILVHEFGHFIAAKKIGVRVEVFSLGFGAQLFKRKKGPTEYSLGAIPLGGYVKMAGDNLEEYKGAPDEYYSQAPGKRFWIIFLGPLLNYVLGFFCMWLIFFSGYPTLTTKIGGLLEGFPAQQAGLAAGDKILSIDGKGVSYWEDLQREIQKKKDSSSVSLSVSRGGQTVNINVAIKQSQVDNPLGEKINRGLIGITPFDEIVSVRHGFLESCVLGLRKSLDITVVTYKGLWRMVTGRLSVRESMTGPLGIFYITSKAASLGVIAVLHLLAVLSISLAIFNLLPLPILDGGHILLLGLEKIRGRTLSAKTERAITQVGFSLLICLVIFVTYNDIVRIFGGKIQKFFAR